MNDFRRGQGALLVVGHPGHELVVHGWLEAYKPAVAILTDGSGGDGVSRLVSSRRTVEAAGASPGGLFGSRPDSEIYEAFLKGDTGYFLRLLDDVTGLIISVRPALVAGDAMEGYNPVHDLCRALIDRAVIRARSHGLTIDNYDFPVVIPHVAPDNEAGAIILRLDGAQLARKIEAARAYAELGDEVTAAISGDSGASLLEDEELRLLVETHLAAKGARRLDLECLFPVDGRFEVERPTPFYEKYGEYLARMGRYSEVIRYEQHFVPVLSALDSVVASEERASSLSLPEHSTK